MANGWVVSIIILGLMVPVSWNDVGVAVGVSLAVRPKHDMN